MKVNGPFIDYFAESVKAENVQIRVKVQIWVYGG